MPAYVDVVLTVGWIVAGFAGLFTVFYGAVVLREVLADGRVSAEGPPPDRRGAAPGRRAADRR